MILHLSHAFRTHILMPKYAFWYTLARSLYIKNYFTLIDILLIHIISLFTVFIQYTIYYHIFMKYHIVQVQFKEQCWVFIIPNSLFKGIKYYQNIWLSLHIHSELNPFLFSQRKLSLLNWCDYFFFCVFPCVLLWMMSKCRQSFIYFTLICPWESRSSKDPRAQFARHSVPLV